MDSDLECVALCSPPTPVMLDINWFVPVPRPIIQPPMLGWVVGEPLEMTEAFTSFGHPLVQTEMVKSEPMLKADPPVVTSM